MELFHWSMIERLFNVNIDKNISSELIVSVR